MADISEKSGKAVQGFAGKLMVDEVNGRILLQKNGVYKMLIGADDQGNETVKIARDGIDVFSASDSDLIFNSSNNIFKIVRTDTTSYVGSSSISASDTDTKTIPHNLGYTPALVIYVDAPAIIGFMGGGGITSMPITYVLPGASQSNPLFTIRARVDNDNIYIDFICFVGTSNDYSTYTWNFKYYLLQETAN